MLTLVNNTLRKWTTSVWRSYWDTEEYSKLYSLVQDIKSTWAGSDGLLRWSEYCEINDVTDAAIAFMACYEGPRIPNWSARADNAANIFQQLSLDTPPEPPGGEEKRKGMPIWMYLRPFF